PAKQELKQVVEQVEEKEEYDSDIYDNMNDDDLIQVDEDNENEQNQEEFSVKFSRKKLNFNQKGHLLPLSSNIKFTLKYYWEDNPLKKYLQNSIKGAFKNIPVFTSLCEVMALADASREMKRISTEEYDNEKGLSNLFQKGHSQLNTIINSEDLSILYNGDSKDNLDFEILLQQWQRHEAYTSKPLERKFKTISTKLNTSAIQSNKASHFVAYFTNNEIQSNDLSLNVKNDERKIAKRYQLL
ncbi:16172_t:CDS:2, partial [Funneliformis geosporum]